MRKLKLQMHISLDGFVANTNNEPLASKWDDGLRNFSVDILKNVDCILHGRKTAEGFIPYWSEIGSNPKDSEYKLGKLFTDIPKVVFSNTLNASKWDNTTILTGDFAGEIQALKNKKGGDIMVYGGYTFVSSLIQHGLIDEFNLLVNPVALGNGETIFKQTTNLELEKSVQFDCGVNILTYRPSKK
jgi:dihydrofolate reductase